jgi:hypothetical protein
VNQIKKGVELFRADETNKTILNDLILMSTDILNRIKAKSSVCFEASTHEVMNEEAVGEVVKNIRNREFGLVEEFCGRCLDHMEKLGNNYEIMLAEQLAETNKGNDGA